MQDIPKHSNSELWQEAAQKEIDTIHKHGVWKLVPRPAGRKVISSCMVFAHKHNTQGEIVHHKACLVA